jgi:site-specific recombinase XerD
VSRDEVVLNLDEPRVIVRVMLIADRAIDDYLDDLRRQRYSKRTLDTYRRILEEFADRLPRDYDVSKIDVDDVRRFLATKSHLAVGTIAHAEAVLSSWFRWMFQQHKIAANPIDRLARTKRIPAEDLEVVTVDSIDVPRLLEAARPSTERNAVSIAAYLGPRRHAIALLRDTDYDSSGA